jgi:hypothetical protein
MCVRTGWAITTLGVALLGHGLPAHAQDTGVFRATTEAALPDAIFRDSRIDEIHVIGADKVDGLAMAARYALGVNPGDAVDWLGLQAGLEAVRAVEGVKAARFVLERTSNPTTTRLTLEITVEESKPAAQAQFPNLVLNDRARVTLILNGALGAYSDTFPWFGDAATFNGSSPLATNPPTGRRASWGEMTVEAGMGGITQLGRAPVYAYGAATALFSAAAGQDLFTNDTRGLVRVEKAYVGFLYADRPSRTSVNLSFGRQNFNLSDGFLISQFSGSANAGPRPGLYLNPRIAFDMTAILDIKLDTLRLKAFYLNPDELEQFESRTEFAGLNLGWAVSPRTRLGATSIWVPQSDSQFRLPDGSRLAREGVHTLAFDARFDDPFGLKGLWLQSEYARQRNAGRMRAWAAYGAVGYRLQDSGWKPALSYRFSAFSGDDPATPTFERYDPLLSGGLAEWVQGVSFKKLVGNSNMDVHRLRATASPTKKLNLTLDLFDFQARERNNLGGNPALGTLASHDIGREVTLRGDWFAMRRLYLLLLASHAVPGDAIRAAAATDARPWTTLQASAFWHF